MKNRRVWTGERLEPWVFNATTIEHLHRYAIAVDLCEGKMVLDAACGDGYGSRLISSRALSVIGLDISKKSVEEAKTKYQSSNLEFITGSVDNLPFNDASFDVIVSFETLEHVSRHEVVMHEFKRVLRPGGFVIISTPDKKAYSDDRNYSNPFHVKELYFEEFKGLMLSNFSYADFYFQRLSYGSIIESHDSIPGFVNYNGDFTEIIRRDHPVSVYNISIASDEKPVKMQVSYFDGDHILKLLIHNNTELVDRLLNSPPYKLGRFLLWPIIAIRSLVRLFFINKEVKG